ncbi:MAG TPA: DUF58 domain-containing protein [Rhizomicrobium sp.]|nr:DUF58 domain-containing protein [Rhizomicrobium sp.]
MSESFSVAKENRAAVLGAEADALGAALPPLLVAAERLASTVALGVHGRRKSGMGETFWQFRRYAQGDARGAIDWRQSAKSQHLFVREREWEAAETVWFWCDGSSSMGFSSGGDLCTKGGRANLLALALASLLVRGGERVAIFGDREGPVGGRPALRHMARALAENEANRAALPPEMAVGKRAQVIWLSDFLSPLDAIEGALGKLAGRGLGGHLVQIVDPAEQDFPFSGRTRFEWRNARDGEIFGRAETAREAYRRRFEAHSEGVRELARRFGWSFLLHRTDARPEAALIALHAQVGEREMGRVSTQLR